jgi:hypothetical protein
MKTLVSAKTSVLMYGSTEDSKWTWPIPYDNKKGLDLIVLLEDWYPVKINIKDLTYEWLGNHLKINYYWDDIENCSLDRTIVDTFCFPGLSFKPKVFWSLL